MASLHSHFSLLTFRRHCYHNLNLSLIAFSARLLTARRSNLGTFPAGSTDSSFHATDRNNKCVVVSSHFLGSFVC